MSISDSTPRGRLAWLPVAVALGVLLQMHRPVWDVDIFWQLKLGEITLAHGLPANEPFLADRENEPLAVVAWLGQVLYAGIRQVLGWPGLRAVDALIWIGGFWVIAAQAVRQSQQQRGVVIGFLIAWVAAVPFASVRPQSFALLAFGVFVVLLRSQRKLPTTVILVTALCILWQNLHPSAGVALGYLLARAVGEWLSYALKLTSRPRFTSLVLVPCVALATLTTPAGWEIYTVSAANRDRCVWDGLQVTEWFPLWDFFPEGGRLQAVLAIACTLLVAVVTRRKQRLVDLLPFLALTVITILTHRFVIFWGVTAIPIWQAAFQSREDSPPTAGGMRWPGLALVIFACLFPALWFGRHFSPTLPVHALLILKKARVAGPVYCPYTFGGVVTDYGYPQLRPTHDGRYYLFSREQLDAHHAARRGEVSLRDLEREFRPAAFLLPPQDGLVQQLQHPESGWVRLYEDDSAVAFVPEWK